jgi:hypothetical protein
MTNPKSMKEAVKVVMKGINKKDKELIRRMKEDTG